LSSRKEQREITHLLLNELARRVENLEKSLDDFVEVRSEEFRLVDSVAEVDESSGRMAVNARDGVLEGLEDDGDEFTRVERLESELEKKEERSVKGFEQRATERRLTAKSVQSCPMV